MDARLATEKARQLKISVVQIVREEYEIVLLSSLFDSSFAKKLVFRGGTALRLAYNSPRFSDDLDFSLLGPIRFPVFRKWCREVTGANPNLSLAESIKKRFTLFALFKVNDPILKETISIKIEISLRREQWVRDINFTLMRLSSEVTPKTALAQVVTPSWIEKEKLSIDPPRVRDIFDLWFIGQLLNRRYKMDFSRFGSNEVKRELNRLLPEGKRMLVEPWLLKK